MKKLLLIALAFISLLSTNAQTRESAVVKTMNERYELASAEFKTLIAATPTNGDLYFFAGDNYFYWGELDSAEAIFRKGQEMAPLNPLNYVGLGRIAWFKNNTALSTGQYAKAQEIISTKSNKIDKTTQATAFLKMAETYVIYDNKNINEAFVLINKAIAINDKNPEAFVQLGDCLAEKDPNNPSAAIAEYTNALNVDPKYTRAMLRKGMLYTRVQQSSAWEEALKYFDQAIAIDPNFAPAYREKAEIQRKSGLYKEAVESYAKYYELNKSCRVQQRYAAFVFLSKDYANAIVELEKALPCNPDYVYMYRFLGKSYYETGDFAKGLENINIFFERADAAKIPIIGDDYAYKGRLLNKSGQDSLAIVMFNEAAKLDTAYAKDAYNEIGAIHFKAKRYAKAAEAYKTRIDLLKDAAKPLDYYYYGQALYFSKEYQKSIDAFGVASKDYYDSDFWRGRGSFKLDNAEAPAGLANPFYASFITRVNEKAATNPKVIESNKKNLIETYSYYGFYYLTQKNYECSKAAWLKVQELDPENAKAKAAMTDPLIIAATGNCDVATGAAPVLEIAPEQK